MPSLEPGLLWPLALQRKKEALARGVLQPIETESERVEQDGVSFVVRTMSGLRRKPRHTAENPFLPYEEALFVADMSASHVCLLNRFNVIEHHLLFVTRDFEEQELPLTVSDMEVLLAGLRELDGLAFYNGGVVAGASQRHRHLQLVPLPLAPETRLPMCPLIRAALHGEADGSALPFRHAITGTPREWLENPAATAAEAHECYARLLSKARVTGRSMPDVAAPLPAYNLLATRDWMLVVPRAKESWRGAPVNALGFAGSLVVRERRELEALKAYGPMNVLRHVAFAGSDHDLA